MVDVIIAPEALVQHCRRARRSQKTVATVGSRDVSDTKALIEWLSSKDEFSNYESWFQLGMALRLEYGDAGLDIWRLAHDETVTEAVEASKWESFASESSSNSITLASFMKRAHVLGWTGTVRPSLDSMFGGIAHLPGSSPLAPANPSSKKNYLKTVGDCVRDFVPPDYLVDGILQRRFCYSLTAQTGVGKTTVAMLLAAHVATGKPLGEIEVERGTVLYFAGENPTDITMRWMGICKEMNLDPETIDVHIIEGTKRFSEEAREISQEIVDAGLSLSLVIVDTAAAYFEGDNDNDNVQAGNHARVLRSLCTLPGGPCVLILCHPTKNAADDNLVPRGGGAFLAEVDGNCAIRRDGDVLTAFALGKFRGPEFTPINFSLKVIRDHPRLVDTKGRPVPTIVAVPISASDLQRAEQRTQTSEDKVLELLCNEPGLANKEVADRLGWANHSTASRILMKLAGQKLIEQPIAGRGWLVTAKGQKGLNLVGAAAARPVQSRPALVPAVLGDAAFPTPMRPGTPPPMPPPY